MTKLILILLAIAAFMLFASLWGFYISVRPPKIVSIITPKELDLAYEQVKFTTRDGLDLSGWFIPRQSFPRPYSEQAGQAPSFIPLSGARKGEKAKTIILLHGYPADKGDILPALAFLSEKYNLFLFDFRYLGGSGGTYSTAGAKEVEDLKAAIQYLKSRGLAAPLGPAEPNDVGRDEFGVWGFSMGGAVALMTALEAPEIKAIVSESSYASLDRMALELYRIPILKYPLAYLTNLWAKIFLGIDLKKISPAESAKTLAISVLVVHSKNDEVIPFKNALLIQESLKNNSKAEFWFSVNGGPPSKDGQGASGGEMHGQFGKTYQEKIKKFFLNNL